MEPDTKRTIHTRSFTMSAEKLQAEINTLKKQIEKLTCSMTDEGHKPSTSFNTGHMARNTKPPKFKSGESFNIFCERFIDYIRLTEQSDNLDILIMQCVDDETYLTLRNVVEKLTPQQKCDAKVLCEILQNEIQGDSKNANKQQLMNLKQGQNETVTQFCNNIQEKARQAYGTGEAASDISQIVLLRGLRNNDIKRKLNEAAPSSFMEAMRLAKHLESVEKILDQNNSTSSIKHVMF